MLGYGQAFRKSKIITFQKNFLIQFDFDHIFYTTLKTVCQYS